MDREIYLIATDRVTRKHSTIEPVQWEIVCEDSRN